MSVTGTHVRNRPISDVGYRARSLEIVEPLLEQVAEYDSLSCLSQLRRSAAIRTKSVVKPMRSSRFPSRAQIEVVELACSVECGRRR
jgi:hypothetical protein